MHDVIIVGGGMAGLTAGAYLSQSKYSPVIFEKEADCGGLVNSFQRDGFTYDGGIRAAEDQGILFPMLKDLGLDLEFLENRITLGIEDQVIQIERDASLSTYQQFLESFYPESRSDIAKIVSQMRTIMDHAELQASITNPVFLDIVEDGAYFLGSVLPWMLKYVLTASRFKGFDQPAASYLSSLTDNQSLVDIICQHFFTGTPASFALSYLSVYKDYHYPLGGTGTLPGSLRKLILRNYGAICNNTRITEVDPTRKLVKDQHGREYRYRQLIWAADQNALYDSIHLDAMPGGREKQGSLARKAELEGKVGSDSVLTLYLAVDLEPEYFSKIASEHFFYSPQREGESAAGPAPSSGDRAGLEAWLKDFLLYTTYEISIPVLRDPSLAPEGQSGLIISCLFDYHLTSAVQDQGWYEDFKHLCQEQIINVLDDTIYSGIKDKVIHQFISTPVTIARVTANTHGAITGWSYTNHPFPAENRLMRVFSAPETPLRDIWQAGQWTFSPSGLPIAILTGKIAADRVIKSLRRSRGQAF